MPRLTEGARPGQGAAAPAVRLDAAARGRWLPLRRALRRNAPYVVVGALFWLVVSAAVLDVPIAADFGQNASAVERIIENWRHPTNPVIRESGAGSPYFTPYPVVLGLAARATGTAAWVAMRWSGLLNLAVLVAGIGAYTRTLSRRPLAPVYALAAFTLLWGWQTELWSGFCGLASLTRIAPYPSTLAVGLTFWLWTWTDRLVRRGARPGSARWGEQAGLGVLAGLLLLIHPITSLAAAVGLAATVAGRQRGWSRRDTGRWAVTTAAALAVATAWPYFDVFGLAGDTTVDPVHRVLYEQLLPWYGLSAAGLPALAWRARRRLRDPLVLMFAADCLIAAYGWFSGHYTYGRVFALLPAPLQFALAVELARIPPWTRLRAALVPLAVGAACVGFAVQGGAVLPDGPLPHPYREHDYRWAARHIRPGDVVLTDGYSSSRVLPAYGAYMVSPPWPDPSTPIADLGRRLADQNAYFAPRTRRAERRAIVRRYGVRWLLLSPGERVPYDGRQVAASTVTGERLVRLRR